MARQLLTLPLPPAPHRPRLSLPLPRAPPLLELALQAGQDRLPVQRHHHAQAQRGGQGAAQGGEGEAAHAGQVGKGAGLLLRMHGWGAPGRPARLPAWHGSCAGAAGLPTVLVCADARPCRRPGSPPCPKCCPPALQGGAARGTGGQGAEEGGAGVVVRRARGRKHPQQLQVGCSLAWVRVGGVPRCWWCRLQALPAPPGGAANRGCPPPPAPQAARARSQHGSVAGPGRRHQLGGRGLGQRPPGARRARLAAAGLFSCSAAGCGFVRDRAPSLPASCAHPRPCLHPPHKRRRCCAQSIPGCRPACTR